MAVARSIATAAPWGDRAPEPGARICCDSVDDPQRGLAPHPALCNCPSRGALVFTAPDGSRFVTAAEKIAERLNLKKVNWSVMYTLSLRRCC